MKHKQNVVDQNVKCKCGKAIKLNLIERKDSRPKQCYACYKASNPGHSRRDYTTWPKHINNFKNSEKGKVELAK